MFPLFLFLPVLLFAFLLLGYGGVPLWGWTLYAATGLLILHPPLWLWGGVALLALVFNLPFLRRRLLTAPIMWGIQRLQLLPHISETERAAIDAGTVWVEGEFFSGQPDWQRIQQQPYPQVTPELQAFLDGPVEQVCRMASDWEIYRHQDLPAAVWDYLKQERFLGMMLPREYGGLGFSNLAYSSVMAKLASRSFIHTATVGVTNSLGPGKLLLNYGTPVQKDYYLPRLAKGEEIPCFALTEPTAGSDAASITAQGVVFRGEDGQLYLRLNFRKRYITLGTIATLIGLAVKLSDPENLLGQGSDLGITCVLVPANTPGVSITQRHDPMGVPFFNSPIVGKDVVIPVDQIIGGVEQAGQGWKMLMQSLAAGRGISFPATCTGVAKLVARVTGAYARVRRQFGLSIGRFEGIEEPLARIGALTYLLDAARIYTCGAVDQGERPPVVSAIAKYQFTEIARKLVNDGMDILGGAGICRGPHNLLANIYTAMPIPITVEGANILTRTMMIFGQGVIRCHPYVYAEVKALEQQDVFGFDQALWSHLGFLLQNGCRVLALSLTRGRLAAAPGQGATARYYQKLSWAAATFALLTDLVLLGYGGSLKRQEKLTGRLADMVSWLYLSAATLRRFEAEGAQPADVIYVDWAVQYGLGQIQQAVIGTLANLPIPAVLRSALLAWWQLNPIGSHPTDRLGGKIAQQLQIPGSDRDRLTAGIYIPDHPDEALGRLEEALRFSIQADAIEAKIKAAHRSGQLSTAVLKPSSAQLVEAALAAGIITKAETQLLREAELVRNDAIQVDAFSLQGYQQHPHSGDFQATDEKHCVSPYFCPAEG
jgi:acyl-CoA dehydrogenase